MPTNWSTGTVPNDTNDSNVTIGSGKTANVNDGKFSAGYIYVGSSGVLILSGSGNGLTIGNTVNTSGASLALAGNGGQTFIQNSAVLSASGRLLLGDAVTPAGVTHPRLTITNATVNFSSLQFLGGNANVQPELILNEGATLTLDGVTTGSSYGGTLIFNGGITGFGKLNIGTFDATKVVNLQINPSLYTGTGTFTLINATTWTGNFSSITFNDSTYIFGTDIGVGNNTWNISRSGSNLVLNVVPEPGMLGCLITGAGVLYFVGRRRILA